MQMNATRQPVIPPDDHIVTAQEALEPLYLKLEAEVDLRLIDAAVKAGWSSSDILKAIDQLRNP